MAEPEANRGDGSSREILAAGASARSMVAEPAQFRMVLVSFLAGGIGLLAGLIAFALYRLIGLFTNIAFYGRFVADFTSARHNHLGLWVIPIPVIGGIIVGFMAKYGSSKIKGHGIPEAMEAVMVSRSRIAPRVAILKPISAAIAIGTARFRRRAVRRRGSDYPNRRRGGVTRRTAVPHHGVGTQGAARLWRSRGDVGYVQYPDCGRDPGH